MVNIKVYYRNPSNFVSILADRIASCQCYIIDEAEPIRACLLLIISMESFPKDTSVMTWRPPCTESIPTFPSHDRINGVYHSSCRMKCCQPRLLRYGSVSTIKILDLLVVCAG